MQERLWWKAESRELALKRSVVVSILALVLAVPALAFAVSHTHSGEIEGDPSSYIAFDLIKTDFSGKRVANMVFSKAPYTCESDPSGQTDPMDVKGSFKVKHHEFGGTRELDPDAIIDPSAKITGKLKDGGKVVGTIRVKGELAGPGSDCHSATLDWAAEKVN